MKKLLRNKKGFTLIELIVVILILAILAAILVPSIINYVGKAEESRNMSNARAVYSELSIATAARDNSTLTEGNGYVYSGNDHATDKTKLPSSFSGKGINCTWTVVDTNNVVENFKCYKGLTGTDGEIKLDVPTN